MPKYTFECDRCKESVQKYTPKLVERIVCETCGGDQEMIRIMPQIAGPASVTERVDAYSNVNQIGRAHV